MLGNTFLHLSGIGQKRERQLWEKNILNWDTLEYALKAGEIKHSPILEKELSLSRRNLEEKNAGFFSDRLPADAPWRLLNDFRQLAVYLDIETTGLGKDDHVTTISIYDGEELKYYVWGDNLHHFLEDIKKYKLIITYNGKCFDIPFLEKYFHTRFKQAHLDLRYILKKLGYMGGLKSCEKQMGIQRKDLDGVNGYTAVLLWQEYTKNKSTRALETLLSYNMEDTINLEKLAYLCYNKLIMQTPFKNQILPVPDGPSLPFKPDLQLLQKILQKRR